MATNVWVQIELCREGDARSMTIEDGKLWVPTPVWARVRNQKGLRFAPGKPVVLQGDFKRVEEESPTQV